MLKIISLESNPNSQRDPSDYVLVVEALPYFGAHSPVGVDHITFKINLTGIQSIKFKHIKNEELLP